MEVIINLNEKFNPFGGYNANWWQFPDNTTGVKVNEIPIAGNQIKIVARLNSNEELVRLMLLRDAVQLCKPEKVNIFISYLPYARQDRKCCFGESFSLKLMANLINLQNYKSVEVFDVHSGVASALIDNFVDVNNFAFVKHALRYYPADYVLVSPDFGASKKIESLAKHLRYNREIVQANKVRDLENGKIKRLDITGNVKSKVCVIVDDICSRGGTFIGLADKLKELGAAQVNLVVSHFEDTCDKELIFNSLDQVITTNSFKDFEVPAGYGLKLIKIPLSAEIL